MADAVSSLTSLRASPFYVLRTFEWLKPFWLLGSGGAPTNSRNVICPLRLKDVNLGKNITCGFFVGTRSRIAVSATLPVPYRVCALASAMTTWEDCRCFVSIDVISRSGNYFFTHRPKERYLDCRLGCKGRG